MGPRRIAFRRRRRFSTAKSRALQPAGSRRRQSDDLRPQRKGTQRRRTPPSRAALCPHRRQIAHSHRCQKDLAHSRHHCLCAPGTLCAGSEDPRQISPGRCGYSTNWRYSTPECGGVGPRARNTSEKEIQIVMAQNKPRIIIVGGGFGGVKCAETLPKKLSPDEAEIVLFNEQNHLVFSPLLAEAVGSSISPLDVVVPLRQLLPNVLCRTEAILNIDLARNEVERQSDDGHLSRMQ